MAGPRQGEGVGVDGQATRERGPQRGPHWEPGAWVAPQELGQSREDGHPEPEKQDSPLRTPDTGPGAETPPHSLIPLFNRLALMVRLPHTTLGPEG